MARVLIHVARDKRLVVDPDAISHVALHGEGSRVHRPGEPPLDELRKLGALAVCWKEHGFVRIHDECLLNPCWVRELFRQDGTAGLWQVVLDDADGTRLEVERELLSGLWAAFGER